jgi:hypothetical protein
MLPLIVIGATDAMRQALGPYAEVGHIEHHPTAQAAHFALQDAATHQLDTKDDQLRWRVHVAYGPLAYGPAIVDPHARLPHSGHTLTLGWMVNHEPSRPRRYVSGEVSGTDPATVIWQAATVLHADHVIDLARPVGVSFLVRYLEWKDGS